MTKLETDLVTNIAAGWTAFIYSMCLSLVRVIKLLTGLHSHRLEGVTPRRLRVNALRDIPHLGPLH